jgi:hypothetical protein
MAEGTPLRNQFENSLPGHLNEQTTHDTYIEAMDIQRIMENPELVLRIEGFQQENI